ncbi:ABC transporter permease [Deminuibacter soli]|uniref:ABC transporter permease n=1 Tax=Deminuibacter soli TaxID=2291815 RepID=A0A3E1NE10_9BACT|nr:ABC transporter permease [Deminuibacter soli]RFM26190.1 ABC transporter permease [Deminuibacter soli]
MSKISLILQREYLSRVKDKTFILTTLLTPLLFVGFIAGATYLSIAGKEKVSVAVADTQNYFHSGIKSDGDVEFSFPQQVDTANFMSKGYTALLIVPASNNKQGEYTIVSKKSLGMMTMGKIENSVNAALENRMLLQAGVQREKLDSIHNAARISSLKAVLKQGNNSGESNQGLAYGIGYGSGILIYLTMLLYGMMLMRGVMEEKTNRIAEVVVSSVKPFELMLGKIIGIGAVGLTQFLMWGILIIGLSALATSFVPHETLQQVQTLQQNGGVMPGGGMMQASEKAQAIYKLKHNLSTANWPLIIGCFIFYFLGGYLFYASLFAAVGSVTEDIQGSRSLTVPVTMPIIFSFIVMTNAVQVPDSPVAIWASIIPFSSPMVMMARIAYGVPGTVTYVQLISSILLLVASFLFTTWMAGKIYRTGILMYGKKITWGEMMKWAFKRA